MTDIVLKAVILLADTQICENTDEQLRTFFSDGVFCVGAWSSVFLLHAQIANARMRGY